MNVAARVQTIAEPDTVVVTATTHRLIAGSFSVEELGTHVLKGVPEPVTVYLVRAALDRRMRRQGAAKAHTTPFVGRAGEVHALRQRWTLARSGQGQAVLIVGEAGIGKSRLVEQLRSDPDVAPVRWVEVSTSPYQVHTPFGVLRELLEQELAWSPDLPPQARLLDLERTLAATGIDPSEAGPLLGALLGLPVDEHYGRALATAEQQRKRLIQALVRFLRGLARDGPLVLLFEDLHWADPSTLETIGLLIQEIATDAVLVLMTARSEFVPPWPIGLHHARIALNRLTPAETRDIVARVAANLDPTGALIDALVSRTDGVPLFAEELARAVFEQRADSRAVQSVPATLQDSLLARLDRLGAVKEIAQVASVIGRTFSASLLARLLPSDQGWLAAGLMTLVDADVLCAGGRPPQATYQFTHALVQEAAYESLLKRRRRELHADVARALVDTGGGPAELLAQHWTAAGASERAAATWAEAAEQAWARSAFLEASTHYGNAIHALLQLPESPERAGRELELQLRRATALQYGKGFVVPEAAAAMTRARALSEHIGGAEQRLSTLLGIWTLSLSRGEIAAAGELADQMLAIAEAAGRPAMLCQALSAQAGSRLHLCDLAGAIACADRALAIPALAGDDPLAASYLDGQPLLYSGIALALLGKADQARERCSRLLTFGDGPATRPLALVANLVVRSWLREVGPVLELKALLQRETEQFQVPLFTAWGWIYGGWALAMQGRCADGIDELRRGLAEHVGSGQRLGFTQYLGLLAEAQCAAGALEDGLATIDEALGSRASEERWHRSELLRIRAALLAARGADAPTVEAAYGEAIATARQDGTRLLERRAATGLARLLAAHGRGEEARALLAPLHASFTEGFDTVDHCNAASLLATL